MTAPRIQLIIGVGDEVCPLNSGIRLSVSCCCFNLSREFVGVMTAVELNEAKKGIFMKAQVRSTNTVVRILTAVLLHYTAHSMPYHSSGHERPPLHSSVSLHFRVVV